ncbi:MAG: hypothetical protein D6693_03565 [Planctomycetota bacterium]|nr:MAG: hypothetical protein D6693_03565 [Planctomycetota bacterium]
MSARTHPSSRVAPGAAVLWASAIVLAGLILTSAASRLGPGAAQAGLVWEKGDMTVLTAGAGNNEDVLLVLDTRAGKVLVYGIANGQTLEHRGNFDVATLFQPARPGPRRR